jgi:hypothetical protein
MILASIAGEPPRPFEQIVTFQPRTSRPPETSDPALTRLGIAAQYGVSTLVTGQGYLDALERLSGAQAAGDLNWSITHWGVVQQCRQTLAVDLATTAAALFAAAQSLKTSTFDLSLTGNVGDVRDWIESPGVERTMARHLDEAGLLPMEIQAIFRWWKTNPVYEGSAATISAELEQASRKVYGNAERLIA